MSLVTTYDFSWQQNFKMNVLLLWTISKILAYGMLFGWMSRGRLSCPYCDSIDSFQLKYGQKTCWFDYINIGTKKTS